MERSAKFNLVKLYFDRGLWNEAMVRNAVTAPKPWITAEEAEKILNPPAAVEESATGEV